MFVNNYKTNNVSNLEKLNICCVDDVVINKHNTLHTNDNINVAKINKLVIFNDNNYFTKKTEHTNNITNNITRHNHNNYEHKVIKKVNKHIKHINNYDTEINHYSNKSLNKKN